MPNDPKRGSRPSGQALRRARPHFSGRAGLGLSIAQWIVTTHGGTIAVENRAPQGARFTVELPSAD